MSESDVAIVGSGIVGATLAYDLTRRGFRVRMFEKGPAYPYPHAQQFEERIRLLYDNPAWSPPPDIQGLTVSGDYPLDLDAERYMRVGGSATRWAALTLRMRPSDFETRSRFGYGNDWPVGYAALEPDYVRAERLLAVAGTDQDNPFAVPRSAPYPLPPFDLSSDDQLLGARMAEHGITLHTTPQARTRIAADGRPGCANYGTCHLCPIGARYSPNHHLQRAAETGLLELSHDVSVRRLVPGDGGERGVLAWRNNADGPEYEHAAQVIVVAAGAIETTRLLLLSGLDARGRIGQDFTLHYGRWATLRYEDRLFPGRVGAFTGQSQQFIDTPTRGRHAAVKLEFSSIALPDPVDEWKEPEVVRAQLSSSIYRRKLVMEGESPPSAKKYVTLSEQRDRFGDPFAHVHYELADLDYATFEFMSQIQERVVQATDARESSWSPDPLRYASSAHHMGGCRMGDDPESSVVDSTGRLHGTRGVYVVGGSTFPGSSGAMNPTLTMVALAFRSSDRIAAELAGSS